MAIVEVPEPTSEWRVIFADGYFDNTRLSDSRRTLIEREYPLRESERMETLVLAAEILLLPRLVKNDGYFDAFLIRPNERKHSLKISQGIIDAFDTAQPKDDYVMLCLVEEKPIQTTRSYKPYLESIGLHLRDAKSYASYRDFREACRKLGEKIIVPYVAPCIIAERIMQKEGFDVILP